MQDGPVPARLSRLWALIWAAHALGAAGWWWFMAPGFPFPHPHYWSHGVVPLALALFCLVGLASARRGWTAAAALALFLPAAWAAAAVAALLLFPASAPRLVPLLLAPAAVLAPPVAWAWRHRPSPRWAAAAMLPPAALAGAVMVWAQRAPEPDTRPLGGPLPEWGDSRGPRPGVIELAGGVRVLAEEGAVEFRRNGLRFRARPLLTFRRRSPDRCWSLFASARDQAGPARRLTGWRWEAGGAEVRLRYTDDGESTLRVRSDAASGAVEIEAHSRVDRPVYSHLNSWCELMAEGGEPMSVAFSPCPARRVEVRPFGDFYWGHLRLAWLDGGGVLHVGEAGHLDKGPYRELASGPLPEGGELAVTLYDGARAACRVTFADWAAQAGRALSPDAGYGLPVNAVQFSRYRADPPGHVTLALTLAGTEVGRGRDSVGHAAGTYRNRLRVEPCPGP